ncbi:LPXTG cell wall anchor domain-containing protein [Dactylosporangium sp. NPDC048998]|uniref:LPXTG cell wall anchor domain-containing protein n=1 Tax=Dactylosporangium sp. NPDC048998 TaxID=3363976 RepID=UPI00371E966F
MKLRGIVRAAAAAAVTALFIGGLGTPAHAAGDDDFPGAILNIPDTGVWAATAPNKGCAGIDTGSPVAGKDGWLFSKPAGEYTDLQYLLIFFKGDIDEPTDIFPLILNSGGVFTFDLGDAPDDPEALAKAMTAKTQPKLTTKGAIQLPQAPAPDGVTGKLVTDGGWVKTPAGWGLFAGAAITEPLLSGRSTFDLVRACPASVTPSASASASPSPRPSLSASPTTPPLPVTGSDTWLLGGAGAAMVAAGVVLFVVYRRRQNVKFVA